MSAVEVIGIGATFIIGIIMLSVLFAVYICDFYVSRRKRASRLDICAKSLYGNNFDFCTEEQQHEVLKIIAYAASYVETTERK